MHRKLMPAAQNLSRHGDAGNGAEEGGFGRCPTQSGKTGQNR